MRRPAVLFAAILAATLLGAAAGEALDTEAVLQLKAAGVGDETIALVAAERVVETAAYSVADIVALKRAGVGEETIRALIRAGSFLRGRQPIVYGRSMRPVRLASLEDLVSLHREGLSDEVLAAVVAVAGDARDADRRRAAQLLERMQIRVDLRDR